MNMWQVQLFNWKEFCDHQGPLLSGWMCACVCLYSFVSLFVSVGQSCQSSSRWWVSTLSDGLQIHLVIDQTARPINRSETLAKSVWSATWLSSYVFSIVSLCREQWTLHLKWTGHSSGAPPPLWRTTGASDARWCKADNSLWNYSTSCFISIPWLNSCVHTCRYVRVHAAHVRTYICVLVGENVIKMEENISVIGVISVKGRQSDKKWKEGENQYLKSGRR